MVQQRQPVSFDIVIESIGKLLFHVRRPPIADI
jgi:hypothetical protein